MKSFISVLLAVSAAATVVSAFVDDERQAVVIEGLLYEGCNALQETMFQGYILCILIINHSFFPLRIKLRLNLHFLLFYPTVIPPT